METKLLAISGSFFLLVFYSRGKMFFIYHYPPRAEMKIILVNGAGAGVGLRTKNWSPGRGRECQGSHIEEIMTSEVWICHGRERASRFRLIFRSSLVSGSSPRTCPFRLEVPLIRRISQMQVMSCNALLTVQAPCMEAQRRADCCCVQNRCPARGSSRVCLLLEATCRGRRLSRGHASSPAGVRTT